MDKDNATKHRGVRRHANGWLVEHGTKPRVRAYFSEHKLAVAYKAHLIATDNNPTSRLDRRSFISNTRAININQSCFTPKHLVEVSLNEKIKRYPVSEQQWRSHSRASIHGFAMLGYGEEDCITPLTRDLGDKLIEALRTQYPGSTIKCVIRMLNLGANKIWKSGSIPFNPFEGTETMVHYPVSHKTWTGQAEALSVEQSVAVLRALPNLYRPVMLTMLLTGMRIAETMALRVGDVNIEERLISISRQRSGGELSARNRTKSPSSTRLIPISALLTDVLDRTIISSHGKVPDNKDEMERWHSRWLFIGLRGGAMDPRSVTNNIGRARRRVGLDSSVTAGKVKPSHDCRATFITECSSHPELASGLLSRYVGHKNLRVVDSPLIPAAIITGSYNRPGLTHLREFVNRLENLYVAQFIKELNGWDMLSESDHSDPISAAEAAEILGVTDEKLYEIVRESELIVITSNHKSLFERRAVHSLREKIESVELSTYTRTKVLELLQINDCNLRSLVNNGRLRELIEENGRRRYHGEDVENLVLHWRERIERLTSWLRISQTASIIGCSSDTVRRMVDEGSLSGWIDPVSGRGERFVDPDAVKAYINSHAWSSTAQLSTQLTIKKSIVEAALFRVRAKNGIRGSRNKMNDEEKRLVIELLSSENHGKSESTQKRG